jgi:hypothetical protein
MNRLRAPFHRLTVATVALTLGGPPACRSDGGSTTAGSGPEREDSTTTTSTDTDATDPTIGGPTPCERTDDCGTEGQHCVAAYDAGTSTPGPGLCVGACLDADDLTRWCVDDGSCCEGLRCHAVDGFCIPRGSGSTGEADGTDGTDGTDGSSSSGGLETDGSTTDDGTSSSSTGGAGA